MKSFQKIKFLDSDFQTVTAAFGFGCILDDVGFWFVSSCDMFWHDGGGHPEPGILKFCKKNRTFFSDCAGVRHWVC